VFIGAVGTLIAALLLLALGSTGLAGLAVDWLVFFAGIQSARRPRCPPLIRISHRPAQGYAIGVYSKRAVHLHVHGCGGGGWLSQHYGAEAVFGFCAVLAWSGCCWHWVCACRKAWTRAVISCRRWIAGGPWVDAAARRLPGVREVMLSGGRGVPEVTARAFDEQNDQLLGGEI